MLRRDGHTVAVARDGREAVARWESESFDVVLMDVQMPQLDGFEATRAIREAERERGGHVPIVALTAHAMKGDRQRCLAAGMDDYVSKPIRSSVLLATIRSVLERERPVPEPPVPERVAREPEPDVEQVPGDEPPSPAPFGEAGAVDWDAALRTFEGNHTLLRLATEAFLDEHPKMVDHLRGAIESGDAAAVRVAAHTLQGALRYFGSAEATEHAYRIERMGEDGSLGGCPEALAALEEELGRLVRAVEQFVHDTVET
jgi:CheY-like chemotaxis protein/HPt (histidine-containing phosphotransfer) domain-containing protein